MLLRALIFVSGALLSIALVGCKTTSEGEGEQAQVKDAAVSAGATLSLGKDEEQDLYLKMLQVELNAGIKVPKDQLHTSRGIFECHKDGDIDSCYFRVRTMGDELSATQPVKTDLTAKIWTFVRGNRPEIGQEKMVISDITCDYIGKKSPPYTVEDVHCAVTSPRLPEEAVFFDKIAEELGEDVRGNAPYGNQVVTQGGAVACQWLKASPRTPCVVRAIVGGVLQEKLIEVTPATAATVSKALMQALQDHTKLTEKSDKPFDAPSEIMAGLSCMIDNSKIESAGTRVYTCRAKI